MVNNGLDWESGAQLIRALDKSGFPVSAALWLFNPYANEWKLWIGTPLVDHERLEVVYGRLLTILNELPEFPSLVSSIVLSTPNNDLFLKLKSAIRTGPTDIVGIRVKENMINDMYIEDAYIYRLAAPNPVG